MLLKELKKNPNIQSVAVCVSPSKDEVKRMQNLGFDLIQIHGTIQRTASQTAVWHCGRR